MGVLPLLRGKQPSSSSQRTNTFDFQSSILHHQDLTTKTPNTDWKWVQCVSTRAVNAHTPLPPTQTLAYKYPYHWMQEYFSSNFSTSDLQNNGLNTKTRRALGIGKPGGIVKRRTG